MQSGAILQSLEEKQMLRYCQYGHYKMPLTAFAMLQDADCNLAEYRRAEDGLHKEISALFEQGAKTEVKIEELRKALVANPDLRFSQGWEELGMDSHPYSVIACFLHGCANFIRNWTTPFGRPDMEIEGVDWEFAGKELLKLGLFSVAPVKPGSECGQGVGLCRISPKAAKALFAGCESLVDYKELSNVGDLYRHEDISDVRLFYNDDGAPLLRQDRSSRPG